MPKIDYHHILQHIISGDKTQRQSALKVIAEQDENAVAPLIDQFYAGVNEATGLVIIDLISTIGGFEARQLLEDVYHLDQTYKHASWRQSAQIGLKRNGW
jgi:hypothetical protein